MTSARLLVRIRADARKRSIRARESLQSSVHPALV